MNLDLEAHRNKNYILFVLLRDKKNIFLTLLKIWCSFWSPEIIKIDSEAVVISAINKVFPDTVVTGCNVYLYQSVWRQIQNIGNTVQYKKRIIPTHIQNLCCFRRLIKQKAGVWPREMFNRMRNYLYFLITLSSNGWRSECSHWDVNTHRYGTNSATERWNSKLSSIIGKQQPNVFLLVHKLKDAVLVSYGFYHPHNIGWGIQVI